MLHLILALATCQILQASDKPVPATPEKTLSAKELNSILNPDEPTKAVLEFFAQLDKHDYAGAYKALDPNSLVIMNRFAALMSMAGAGKEGITAIDEKTGPTMLETIFSKTPKNLRLSPDEVVGSIVQENHAWVVVGYDITRIVQEFSPDMKDDPLTSMGMEMMFSEKLYFTWEAQKSDGKWRMDLGFWSNVLPLASILMQAHNGSMLDGIDNKTGGNQELKIEKKETGKATGGNPLK